MRTGTKSLLFGVHQFVWHPVTVWLAWVWLYRDVPSWRETVCIVVHDWGYWGKAKMDDSEGERHPEVGASIAGRLFGPSYAELCLLHSRHYARRCSQNPSLLCWPDKFSIIFEPWWFYLPRAWASGELKEYRENADVTGVITEQSSDREWYAMTKQRLATLGRERRSDAVPYVNPPRIG